MQGVLGIQELQFAALVCSTNPRVQCHPDRQCGGRTLFADTQTVRLQPTSPCAARRRRRCYFPDKGAASGMHEFVPDLCQRFADLADLADLVRRKNNKLRVINGSRRTDSVPGHHKNQ